MYFNGQGVDKNEQEACRLFQLAAEQGEVQAQLKLGVMYSNGKGVNKNEQEALRYFQLAADQGHVEAKNVLREMGQPLYNNEQQTASSYQSDAELNRLQNQPVPEEILPSQLTLPDHTVLAESMVSCDDQKQAIQRETTADKGTLTESILAPTYSV